MAALPLISTAMKTNAGDLRGEFLTPEELAVILGVTTRTLARWEAMRIGPSRVKVGRRIFYRRASIASWLASREGK